MADHKTKRAGKAGKAMSKSRSSRAVKGAISKTHKGRQDYTTKKGDKDFHRKGHDEKRAAKSKTMRKPYSKSKKGGTLAKRVNRVPYHTGGRSAAPKRVKSHKAAKASSHTVRKFTPKRGLEHRPLTIKSRARDQKSFLSAMGAIGSFFTQTVPSAARTVGHTIAPPLEHYLQGQASPHGAAHNIAQRIGQTTAEEPVEETALFSGE